MSIGLVLRPIGLPYKRHFYSVMQANTYASFVFIRVWIILDICCTYLYLFIFKNKLFRVPHAQFDQRSFLMYINKVGLWMIKYIFSSGKVILYKNCSDLTMASAVPLFRCWKKKIQAWILHSTPIRMNILKSMWCISKH